MPSLEALVSIVKVSSKLGMANVGVDVMVFLRLRNAAIGNFNSIAIDVNVQVYTTSNTIMNIQDRLHRD